MSKIQKSQNTNALLSSFCDGKDAFNWKMDSGPKEMKASSGKLVVIIISQNMSLILSVITVYIKADYLNIFFIKL